MVFQKTKFEKATSIWPKGLRDEMNVTVAFVAECDKGDFTLRLCAQSDYQLFINKEFIMSGPSRAGRGFYRVDEIDVSKHLTRDKNELLVLVNSYRCDNFYLINQAPFLCAELIGKDGASCETGSEAWRAYRYTQKLQRVQRYAFQRPFTEVYDFTSLSPLEISGDALECESIEIDTFICREVSYPVFPFEPYKCVLESGLVNTDNTSSRFSPWWVNMIGKQCDGFIDSALELKSTDIADSLTYIPDNITGDKIGKNQYKMLEMSANITGFIRAELECESDTTLCLIFDEILINGKLNYQRMECANILVFKLKGGKKYTLISAEPYTFKYMNVVSLDGEISLNSLGIIRTDFNESEIIKTIRDDADEQIKRIYSSALETFRQNSYDIFMDCPSRERAGWLCDSFFTSRVEYLMSGKSTVERAFLSNFVMEKDYGILPKGMLPMCYPADHKDGNFIPNWAMWYVLELKEYLKRTGDRAFVDGVKEKLYALLDYFKGFENERGLLCHLKGWVFVEWSRCNSLTQDINYPTNMLYCAFKEALYELYGDCELHSQASKLKEVIRGEARIGDFFCDNAVRGGDGKYALSGELTETCQYYAFFCEVATPETDSELWEIMIRDFGSKRKQSGKWENIHFSNAFIGNYLRLLLLEKAGLFEELESDIRGYFDYMALKTGTLWENDTPSASCNHGFASHVLIWLDRLGYLRSKND